MKTKILCIAFAVLGFNSYSQVTNGLIAKYPFTGGNANDQVGNHNGNVFGATPTTNRFGIDSAAFYFDNDSSQYIEVPYSADFTPGTNPMSISLWFLSPLADSSDEYIISWYLCGAIPGCTTADAAAYAIGLLDTSRLYYDVRDDNGVDSFYTTSQSLNDNNWHQAVLIFDPANNFAKYYLDNLLLDSITMNISSISDGGTQVPLEIGRVFRTGWGSPSSYFNGKIDDIRIYNRTLSAIEVDSLFNESITAGISSSQSDFYISVYPNPSTNLITIENKNKTILTITSVDGRVIDKTEIVGKYVLDISNYAAGIYFLSLQSGDLLETRKIVKK